MLERAGFVIEEAYGPERVFASYRCEKLVKDSR
jgi:hypothetical protein